MTGKGHKGGSSKESTKDQHRSSGHKTEGSGSAKRQQTATSSSSGSKKTDSAHGLAQDHGALLSQPAVHTQQLSQQGPSRLHDLQQEPSSEDEAAIPEKGKKMDKKDDIGANPKTNMGRKAHSWSEEHKVLLLEYGRSMNTGSHSATAKAWDESLSITVFLLLGEHVKQNTIG